MDQFPKNAAQTASFPARFESLDAVRDFVGQAAADCGFNEKTIYAVELAVDEAFSNIVEHAYLGEDQEDILCTCQIAQHELTVILRDYGRPFNPLDVPAPDLDASLEERDEGGLGLFFMQKLMDEVRFSFIPPADGKKGYNILTMVKRKEQKA